MLSSTHELAANHLLAIYSEELVVIAGDNTCGHGSPTLVLIAVKTFHVARYVSAFLQARHRWVLVCSEPRSGYIIDRHVLQLSLYKESD